MPTSSSSSSNEAPRPTPEPKTLRLLKAAAAIVATHYTIEGTAEILGVTKDALSSAIRDHRPIWAELSAAAKQRTMQQWRPREQTWQRIRKACAMRAAGAKRPEISEAIGVMQGTVTNYRCHYPDLWKAEMDQAMETSIVILRRQAGTDAVVKNVKAYLRRALECERWARANDRPLFEDPGEVTLQSFFETYYRPLRLKDASPRGVADYRSTLRYWTLLVGDPPLKQITMQLLMRFRDCLRETGGRGGRGSSSNNTIRKHMNNVQVLLDKCGPRNSGNRDGAGLLESPPWVKPPRKEYPAVRTVTMEQIGRVYLAADAMHLPEIDGVSPAAWWRALLVLAWNSGLRKRNLLDMRFDSIDWAQHRVEIPPARHKTGRGQSLHLNPPAMEHLRRICTDRELVFPWTGNRQLGPGDDSFFHRNFRRLQLAAGLEGKELFGLQRLRQTISTKLWEHSPQAASLQLGHTNLTTTRLHYVQADHILTRAMDQLPQPKAFNTNDQSA